MAAVELNTAKLDLAIRQEEARKMGLVIQVFISRSQHLISQNFHICEISILVFKAVVRLVMQIALDQEVVGSNSIGILDGCGVKATYV